MYRHNGYTFNKMMKFRKQALRRGVLETSFFDEYGNDIAWLYKVDKHRKGFLYTEAFDEYGNKYLYAIKAKANKRGYKIISVDNCETLEDERGNKYLHVIDMVDEYNNNGCDEDEYPYIIDLDEHGHKILYVSNGSHSKIYKRNEKSAIRL